MKKRTIWTIAVFMGVSFLALLYLQGRYMEDILRMRREQIVQSVSRALYGTAHQLELRETREALLLAAGAEADSLENEDFFSHDYSDWERRIEQHHGMKAAGSLAPPTLGESRETDKQRKLIQDKFLHQRHLLEESVFAVLHETGSRPLIERLQNLEGILARELRNNGVDDEQLSYHYYVTNAVGDTIVACPDFKPAESETTFRQVLFPNDAASRQAVLYIHFPQMQRYIFSGVHFIFPAIFFTLVLLCVFVFTVYSIFRQKRLSEIKNDFINNMTHEFKTPISTISLAAQMLNDPAVGKSDRMFKHISGVITDETKRLRFQVEKVLQMSMFDEKAGTFTRKELSMNTLLEDVTDTFRLKVESLGGTLSTHLDADDDIVFGDGMHLTNVVFNLLDNAVKYRHPERPLEIEVRSSNRSGRIAIVVGDNGIGIKRDDLKRIFDKFYRAHTGNRHDVKGFGLGLAYVRKVINFHRGTIHADSAVGKGTRFVISLPLMRLESTKKK